MLLRDTARCCRTQRATEPRLSIPATAYMMCRPYGRRKTILREAVPGNVWTFEQLLGTVRVSHTLQFTRLDIFDFQ